RPRARRLLGLARPRPRDRDAARDRPRPRREDRRREDLAARPGARDRDAGARDRSHAILGPTLPLSRHVFGAPTRFYKTGVVFAAYLNGHQSHFRMVGGLESARSVVHLAEQFRLIDAAGLVRA